MFVPYYPEIPDIFINKVIFATIKKGECMVHSTGCHGNKFGFILMGFFSLMFVFIYLHKNFY